MKLLAALLDNALQRVLVLLLAAMVLAVTWQVLSRYLLESPSSWSEEVARFLLIWIGLLGAALAFRTKMHIGLDLLADRLTEVSASRLRRLTQILILLFAATVLIAGGGSLVLLTWELHQTSAALGLPMSVVYSVIPLSGALIGIFSLEELVSGSASDNKPQAEG